MLSLLAPTLLACVASPASTDLRLGVVVLAPDGSPAIARIVVSSRAEVFAHGVTAADGRFSVSMPQRWIETTVYRKLDLWAWREGSGLALRSFHLDDLPVGEEIALSLEPPEPAELTVLDERGRPVASGVYFVRLDVGEDAQARKLLLVK